MTELWFIDGELVYCGGYEPYLGSISPIKETGNHLFFSRETGEVYGKRMNSSGEGNWDYHPGIKPEIRHPYEIMKGFCPDDYFAFLVEYFIKQSALDISPEYGILTGIEKSET